MRCRLLVALPALALAMPLSAQAFEGSLLMRLPQEDVREMTWTIKGSHSLGAFVPPSESDDHPIRYLLDNGARTNTMLLPMASLSGRGMQGIRIVRSLAASAPAGAAPKKLGTSQVIAGISCDDYDLNDGAGSRACITTTLGAFVYPMLPRSGGMSSSGSPDAPTGAVDPKATFVPIGDGTGPLAGAQMMNLGNGHGVIVADGGTSGGATTAGPAWARAAGAVGFPLRIWTGKGVTLLEVSAPKPVAVSDSLFVVPAGFMSLAAPAAKGGGI